MAPAAASSALGDHSHRAWWLLAVGLLGDGRVRQEQPIFAGQQHAPGLVLLTGRSPYAGALNANVAANDPATPPLVALGSGCDGLGFGRWSLSAGRWPVTSPGPTVQVLSVDELVCPEVWLMCPAARRRGKRVGAAPPVEFGDPDEISDGHPSSSCTRTGVSLPSMSRVTQRFEGAPSANATSPTRVRVLR